MYAKASWASDLKQPIRKALDTTLGHPVHFSLYGQPCSYVNGLVVYHGLKSGNAWVKFCQLRKEAR